MNLPACRGCSRRTNAECDVCWSPFCHACFDAHLDHCVSGFTCEKCEKPSNEWFSCDDCNECLCGRCYNAHAVTCTSCGDGTCNPWDCYVCSAKVCYECIEPKLVKILDDTGWCPSCANVTCSVCKNPSLRRSLKLRQRCDLCIRLCRRVRAAFDETCRDESPIVEFIRRDGDRSVRYRVMNFLLRA